MARHKVSLLSVSLSCRKSSLRRELFHFSVLTMNFSAEFATIGLETLPKSPAYGRVRIPPLLSENTATMNRIATLFLPCVLLLLSSYAADEKDYGSSLPIIANAGTGPVMDVVVDESLAYAIGGGTLHNWLILPNHSSRKRSANSVDWEKSANW